MCVGNHGSQKRPLDALELGHPPGWWKSSSPGILWKSSEHSEPLSHLSNLLYRFKKEKKSWDKDLIPWRSAYLVV